MSILGEAQKQILGEVSLAEKTARQGSRRFDAEIAVFGSNSNRQTNKLDRRQSRHAGQFYSLFQRWVYVAINHIATRVAGQELKLGRSLLGNGNKSILSPFLRMPQYKAKVRPPRSEMEVIESHDLLDFMLQPNPVQTWWAFLYMSAINYYLTGASYWMHSTSKDGNDELWSVPSTWLEPNHDERLFGSYRLQIPGQHGNGTPVGAEDVARVYLPDPSDPRKSLSPISTQMNAVHIDGYIQSSQQQAFQGGIFPQMLIKIGRVGGRDKGPRRKITAGQRSQLMTAVRKIAGGVQHYGDPLILDQFIESVEPLARSVREMDFQGSELSNKRRVLQAFGLSEIDVGDVQNANRAAAVVSENRQCANVLNPVIEQFSIALTCFVVSKFAPDQGLFLWIDPCVAHDAELDIKRWDIALRNGTVSDDEYRAHQLGIGSTGGPQRSKLLSQPAAMGQITALMKASTAGEIPVAAAANVISMFLGLPEVDVVQMLKGKSVESIAATGMARLKELHDKERLTAQQVLEHRNDVTEGAEREVVTEMTRFFPGAARVAG